MEKIIKGDELMLFNGEKSIAYATSHTLTVNGNSIDISSKDHGYWGASEVGNITWEITSENLYTDKYYGELFDAMVSRTLLSVAFGFASNWNVNGLSGTTTEYSLDKTKTYYTGKVYVTSLTANANSGENATLSITLTGCGALTKVNATATTNYNYDDGNTSGSNSNTGNSNNNSGNTEEIFIGTSVNDEAMGTVTGMGTYYKGESVTLVARANDGYRFLQWTDDVLDNPRTVTADVNGVIYTAVFEKI